jgi:hypothetical protein
VYLTWIEARRASHPLAGVRRRLPHTRGSQLASVFSLHDVIVLTGRDSAMLGADRSGQDALWRRRRDGGACRDRTDDPLLAKQVLSRLS